MVRVVKGVSAVAVLLFVTQGTASAAPIDFDFSGEWYPQLADSMTFSEQGVNVTVTGYKSGSQVQVIQGGAGLGVYSGGYDNPLVDGDYYGNESLKFDFDPSPVALESVTFTFTGDLYGGSDNFQLRIDGQVVLANSVAPTGAGTFDVNFALPDGLNEGSSFEFYTVDSSDDWAIAGMRVSLVGGGGVAVPEPGSLLLLGLGVGGIGLARRRRRRDGDGDEKAAG